MRFHRMTIDESFVVADIPGLIEGAHLGMVLAFNSCDTSNERVLLLHLIDVSV